MLSADNTVALLRTEAGRTQLEPVSDEQR